MFFSSLKKPLIAVAVLIGLWLGFRFVLPLILPFLLGAALALAAEPLVSLCVKKLRFPRWLGAGVGVFTAMVGIVGIVWLIGAAAVKELGTLAGNLPNLEDTARQGMLMAQDFFVSLSEKAPEGMRPVIQRTVLSFFDGGEGMFQQAAQKIPVVLSATIGRVGNGALAVGTGILAAFFISARLPVLKQMIQQKMPTPILLCVPTLQ